MLKRPEYAKQARARSILRRRVGRPLGRWSRAVRFHAGLDAERAPRVFCIGMQRSGTTSFGNFCQAQLGLERRGFDYSITNEWTRAWMTGAYERIFRSADFRTGEVFEDDPWWCPGFYELLAERFPQARFVLITRDEDKWFQSMLAHSQGRAPGQTDLHAAIYGRKAEFDQLLADGVPYRKANWQGLSLIGRGQAYKAHYRTHADQVRRFFAKEAADRFLDIRLEDPEKFRKVAVFLGFPDRAYPDVHSNAIASQSRSLA